jgi:GTP pyrophosphokinase
MSYETFVDLRGFARGRKLFETLKAINVAEKLHRGQKRKSGEDYIEHPIMVAAELVALGIDDDHTLAAAVLHDVIEDCKVTSKQLIDEYGIHPVTAEYIDILSKKEGMSTNLYYTGIRKYLATMLIKIADRCHNVSTMAGVFTNKKIGEYVEETETHVYILCSYCTDEYPQYADQIYVMKYHIISLCNMAKAFLSKQNMEVA